MVLRERKEASDAALLVESALAPPLLTPAPQKSSWRIELDGGLASEQAVLGAPALAHATRTQLLHQPGSCAASAPLRARRRLRPAAWRSLAPHRAQSGELTPCADLGPSPAAALRTT